jgi:hypothetical protein
MVANEVSTRSAILIGLVASVSLYSGTTWGDCIKDFAGEVYCGAGRCIVDRQGTIRCSRHLDGGAMRDRDGQVLCGRGACAKGSNGLTFCSSVVGGHVIMDSHGRVRCYGSCEPGSQNQCESSLAGSPDS